MQVYVYPHEMRWDAVNSRFQESKRCVPRNGGKYYWNLGRSGWDVNVRDVDSVVGVRRKKGPDTRHGTERQAGCGNSSLRRCWKAGLRDAGAVWSLLTGGLISVVG
jgi:hypothetical protein